MTHFFNQPIKAFHLELTNRCALSCLRCSRTGSHLIKTPGDLNEQVIDHLLEPWKDCPLEKRDLFFTLCGNYGDSIYHPRFHEILKHLKFHGVRVNLVTNGSHRDEVWWQKTADLFGERDRVVFSIDGLEETNALYRVGSHWDSVMTAIRFCAPRVKTHWKCIVFSHNEHQIPQVLETAYKLGVEEVRIHKSSRYDLKGQDDLRPKDERWVGLRAYNRKAIRHEENAVQLKPHCYSGTDYFVNYQGLFYPCCACAMFPTDEKASYFSNWSSRFSLHEKTLTEILADPIWDYFKKVLISTNAAPASCLNRCGVAKSYEDDYKDQTNVSQPTDDNLRFDLR